MKPNADEILEGLRHAFHIEDAPQRQDGWVPARELMEAWGVSDYYLRERARRSPETLERRIHKKMLYYRVTQHVQ